MRAAVGVLACTSAMAQDAGELFRRMQHALGGADKIAGIRDFEETVKARTWNTSGKPVGEVRKRVRWIRPNRLRLDQSGPYDTYALYFNGTSGWEILPGGRQLELSGGELKFARKYLSDFMLRTWLADRIPGYEIKPAGRNVIRISVPNQDGETVDIALDPASWLPAKEVSVSLADPTHPVPGETRILEWTTAGDVRFPARVLILHSGARLAEIVTEKIAVNRGLRQEDLAAKPPDLRPDLPGR